MGFFFPVRMTFTKREIDISIFSSNRDDLRYAIELKYPRNGQYPEQMFASCKDVAFAEELQQAGFSCAALMIVVDDPGFYRGGADGIYGYFRAERPIHGIIQKPTGRKDDEVNVKGEYVVRWKPMFGSLKYALIEVGGSD